jgi:hypothetical protein
MRISYTNIGIDIMSIGTHQEGVAAVTSSVVSHRHHHQQRRRRRRRRQQRKKQIISISVTHSAVPPLQQQLFEAFSAVICANQRFAFEPAGVAHIPSFTNQFSVLFMRKVRDPTPQLGLMAFS